MATVPLSLPQGPDTGKVIDLLAKVAVLMAAVLYACGFIVISIHQYTYGIAEISPLRPKILAAGIWFLCFATIPIVLVVELRSFRLASPEHQHWRSQFSTGAFFTVVSCFWLGMILSRIIDVQMDNTPRRPSVGIIVMVMAICAGIVAAQQFKWFPRWIAVLAVLSFGGLVIFCGFRDPIKYHSPSASTIAVWFVVTTYFAYTEMRSRSWKFEIGNWVQSIGVSLTCVGTFAVLFYPHIKPSWGGGAASPVTIYFAKDSVILPGRSVSAKIIDETESGFYIIGGDDKKATFIPRGAVAMLYYSDDASGPFIMKAK